MHSNRKNTIGIIVFCLLLGILLGGCGQPQAEYSLRVMSYNIHHGEGTDGKLDMDRIAEIIRQANPDLMGLNEVDNHFGSRSRFADQAKQLAEKLNMHYVFGPAINTGSPDKPRQYGNAVLSNIPISQHQVHPLSGPTGLEPRSCLEVQVQIGNKSYTFIATHLDHTRSDVRAQQAGDLVKLLGDCPHQTILVGDFNCQPPGLKQSPEWKQRTRAVGLILEKLNDAAEISSNAGESTGQPQSRIDYVFVSPEIKVNSCRFIIDPVTKVASDHYPLIAELELN